PGRGGRGTVAAAARAAASSRSQIVTAAPDAARRWAIASPMPDAPPVTTAWRPPRSIWFICPLCAAEQTPVRSISLRQAAIKARPFRLGYRNGSEKSRHAEKIRTQAGPLVGPGDARQPRARSFRRRLHLAKAQAHR